MRRPARVRYALAPAGAVIVLLLFVLTACSAGGQASTVGRATTDGPPQPERLWEITAWETIPEQWNDQYWVAAPSHLAGVGRYGTHAVGGEFVMHRAATGSAVDVDVPGQVCHIAPVREHDDHAVVISDTSGAWGTSPEQQGLGGKSPTCRHLTVVDLREGKKAWTKVIGPSNVGLYGPTDNVSATEDSVVVTTERRARCWSLPDGGGLDVNTDERCVLGVVVVSGVIPDGTRIARAHDMETGMTLWVDELDPSHSDGPWDRVETYQAGLGGLLRAHYTHTESSEFAHLGHVDPRTGEPAGDLMKVEGGLFLAQVGEITVMGVDEDLGGNARLAGFRAP